MTVVVEHFIRNKEDMIKYLKKILLNQDNKNGRMMNGVNGIANVEVVTMMELLRLRARTLHGMNLKLKKCMSSQTRFWDGYFREGLT
jgi:hypothetical protein